MGLALHPHVGDVNPGATEAGDGVRGLDLVGPVGLVDENLRDGDRVGAAVDDLGGDALICELGALDRKLFDRREGLVGERPHRVHQPEECEQAAEQDHRQQRERPSTARREPRGGSSSGC
ncbi:MAG: hypothetical protein WD009_11040 [Phycisphaeraceae bacterium]